VPSSAATWGTLATVRQRLGDEPGATDAWRRALALDPNQFESLFNLGVAEGQRGNLEAARTALRRFVAEAPAVRYPRELAEARRLLAGIGQPERARP
jgi:Flp pilus assembly protein TadD